MNDLKPYKRRLVLICDKNSYYQLENDEKQRSLITNPEIEIVTLDQLDDFNAKYEILGGTRLTNNMMLVLSPFDDLKYVEISEARSLIPLEKYQVILLLSQYLGARSVTVRSAYIKNKKEAFTLEFSGKKEVVKGTAKAENQSMRSLLNNLAIESNFEGGEIKYDQAKKLLKEKNLVGDLFLSSLLEMRNPEISNDNSLIDLTHKVSLSESLQRTFEFVSKISIPTSYFQIDYKSIVEQHSEISLEINVSF
jgi:hypothetical protein